MRMGELEGHEYRSSYTRLPFAVKRFSATAAHRREMEWRAVLQEVGVRSVCEKAKLPGMCRYTLVTF